MLIDSHCHLETFVKRGEIKEVLNEASMAGVNRMISVGTSSEDWNLYRELAITYPNKVYYSVGLHPCHVDENWEREVELLEQRLSVGDSAAPIALGEIGLDYFHLPKKDDARRAELMEMQQRAFEAQLELAKRCKLPVIIHSRTAFDECVKTIDKAGAIWDKIVFHCFSEGRSQIDRINLRGGRGSFTGIITYKNASVAQVKEAMVEQGVERLMIETDCPYLTPEPHRGKENRPALLRHTFQAAASILQVPVIELEEQITANTFKFFGIEE